MGDNKNFILFAVISLAILIGYNMFYLVPKQQEADRVWEIARQEAIARGELDPALPAPTRTAPQAAPRSDNAAPTSLAFQDAGFVRIETPELSGSISLRGARFDDLVLTNHRVSKDADSDNIQLLKKYGENDAYFASFNWFNRSRAEGMSPTNETAWTADQDILTPESPVTLAWENGAGVKFLIKVSVDDKFMFTIDQTVINTSDEAIELAPYGYIKRSGTPTTDGLYILHEGPIGVFDGILEEVDYDDLKDDGNFEQPTENGGWMGLTDKFWMATLVPNNESPLLRARLSYKNIGGTDVYGADYSHQYEVIAPGTSAETTNRFYAGAKIVDFIDMYEEQYDIKDFNKTIDWGIFWFLTQPIFSGLHWLFEITGNYGVAILLMTVILKLILFPLANKSYRSMAHMKKAQPKIKKLQERYKDDKQKLQQETMALYKTEKINPMAGCLPMIPQMFIFFALYKTLYVTIEMRHQPFVGWITDLSSADPLTPLNLFGLIPWDPPSVIAIGVLPILMGISMWLQQRLNPQTSMDPMQAKIMGMLPIVFTFIMAQFSAGLVLYWTWNNILSIAQQTVIMKRENAATDEAK